MDKRKNKCKECEKNPVVIDEKKYYCGECYCKKYNIKTKEENDTPVKLYI